MTLSANFDVGRPRGGDRPAGEHSPKRPGTLLALARRSRLASLLSFATIDARRRDFLFTG
ncbi:MAG: hypothetical protein DWQ42_12925 [Planctomycetota bacterium]|nr:MAG: hypothetical protein DWQ42_12925 [Planctomycetota bacterium]REK49408.1 MAG: hypothetical protein DWQ46_00215 [Planctomycetota bacterium]